MLTSNNDKILSAIASMTSEGESLVVEKTELMAMAGIEVSNDELDRLMEALEVNDAIALKYTDSHAYCLTMRPKGRLMAEKLKQIEVAEAMATVEEEKAPVEELSATVLPPVPFDLKKLAIICGGSAFAGGFLAAIIAFLVTFFSHR